jgi:hypothetical protein
MGLLNGAAKWRHESTVQKCEISQLNESRINEGPAVCELSTLIARADLLNIANCQARVG